MSKLVSELKKMKDIKAPNWAPFVKTSSGKERPPQRSDWWHVRAASVLSKIHKFGPIGTNKLSKQYGCRKNRGHKPERKVDGSRNIVRKCIQQLEAANLIKQVKFTKAGKVLTKEGTELLKRVKKND